MSINAATELATTPPDPRRTQTLLAALPIACLLALVVTFGLLSPRFLTLTNLAAILLQATSLIVVALGMNFVLLTAGVDLSVGSAMYLAAITVALGLHDAGVLAGIAGALATGALFGAVNATLIVRLRLPAFIATLAMIFVGRGIGLYLSSTRIVFAGSAVAEFGRARVLGVPGPLWVAIVAIAVTWVLFARTPFGPYVRSVGADSEGARRAGVPTGALLFGVYTLCGACAGLGGFLSLSQVSAAAGGFGQNFEFLAIAAAVLGGTSLFGGRGSFWAPIIGALLITTVQNGLAMMNANPYAYPVITGAVIFLAALLDRLRALGAQRRRTAH